MQNSTFPNATDSWVGHFCIHLKGSFWILSETKERYIAHWEFGLSALAMRQSERVLHTHSTMTTRESPFLGLQPWMISHQTFPKVLNTRIFSGKKSPGNFSPNWKVTLPNTEQTNTQIHIFITVTLEFNVMTSICPGKRGKKKKLQSRGGKLTFCAHYWKT